MEQTKVMGGFMTRLLAFLVVLVSQSAEATGRLAEIARLVSCEAILESAFQPDGRQPLFVLETDRLVIRAILAGDAVAQRAAYRVYTHDKVQAMSGDYLGRQGIDQILNLGVPHFSNLHAFGLVNLSVSFKGRSGQESIIGFAQMARTRFAVAWEKGLVLDPSKWFEISFHLYPDYWGQGFGTELVQALSDHVFMKQNAEGVYAQTEFKNNKSGAVLRRVGFQEIDRHMSASINGAEGAIFYALTLKDWKPKLTHGLNIYPRLGPDGQRQVVMVIVGAAPTWTTFRVDDLSPTDQLPLPQDGDRTLLVRKNKTYAMVPKNSKFGGIAYTSVLELEDIILLAASGGQLDRRSVGFMLTTELLEQRAGGELTNAIIDQIAPLIPDNFLSLTVFEKKLVYQKLVQAFANLPSAFPRQLVIIDENGFDFVTRESIINKNHLDHARAGESI